MPDKSVTNHCEDVWRDRRDHTSTPIWFLGDFRKIDYSLSPIPLIIIVEKKITALLNSKFKMAFFHIV